MNNITVNNYIETILNPKGKFKTLELEALLDSEGNPIVHTKNGIVAFSVMIANRNYLLKCFTNTNIISYSRAKLIAQHTQLKQHKHLVIYRYLYREMLVFNAAGEYDYVDLILEEIPKGESLLQKVCELQKSRDYKSSKRVFEGLISMFSWMHDFGLVHSNITPSNIIIENDLNPLLVNYDLAIKQKSSTDFQAMTTLGIIYFSLLATEKPLLSFEDLRLNYKDLSRKIITIVANAEFDNELSKLKELATHIVNSTINLQDWGYIKRVFIELSAHLQGEISMDEIFAMTQIVAKKPEIDIRSQYDFIGDLSDNRIRVAKDDRWQFLDNEGSIAIEGPFDMAYDFVESRAAVSIGGKWGVINSEGAFVAPAIYHDLTWDGEANVIIAFDGSFMGLLNRSGEAISPFVYDSIQICSDGRLLAQTNYYYGFLKPDGSIAIKFKYDSASSFRNGVSEVVIGGDRFLIDVWGDRVRAAHANK